MEENRTVTGPESNMTSANLCTNIFFHSRIFPEEEISQQNISRMQDLTIDEGLEKSTAHFQKEKAPVTQKGLFPNKPSELKTQEVGIPQTEKIGQDWIIVGFLLHIIDLMQSFWVIMAKPKWKLVYGIHSFVFLIINLCSYSWYAIKLKKNHEGGFFILTLMLATIDIINLIFAGINIYKIFYYPNQLDSFSTIKSWIQCIYTIFSLFFSIALMLNDNFWGAFFAISACVVSICHVANVLLSILLVPILVTAGVMEFLIRIVICKFGCPKYRQCRMKYEYGIYRFTPLIAQSSLKCAVCLEEYSMNSSDLVVLLCSTHHVFHETCLFEWLHTKNYCPICRGPVRFYCVQHIQRY